MFSKMIKKCLEKRRVSGLSKGMTVVNELMIPGLKVQKLDQNYGKAQITLQYMREGGEITEDELGAAMLTLKKQYKLLRRRACLEELYA